MKTLSRRTLLRGAGVCLGLPLLDAMISGRARAAGTPSDATPRRFVAINIPLGFIPANFFPELSGRGYALSKYLQAGAPVRDDFTVISGTSHPGVDGGHAAEKTFLTAAPHPGSRSFINTISLDQYLARRLGEKTRFASLTLGDHSLSWSENGVAVPAERSPAKAFGRLFLTGTGTEAATQQRGLAEGRSIMDVVLDDALALERRASPSDRAKLEEFFTAVRETERRLAKAEAWSRKPKAVVTAKSPDEFPDADLLGTLRAHFDVIRLALETDSTRIVALGGTGFGTVPKIQGVELGYHGLSHHGKNPDMLRQLELIERGTMQAFWDFVGSLKTCADGNASLLERTQVLLGSNLGNGNGHLTTNLPIVLAGGGYRHGQHLAFDQKDNYPLPKLFVTMAQRMGLETDAFASSTGTMTGLTMT